MQTLRGQTLRGQTLRGQTLRTQTFFTSLALTGLALTGLTAAPAAHAQTTVYSNIDNYTGLGYNNDGAGDTGPTTIVADDITPITGFAGDKVTGFTFTILNFGDTDATFNPTVDFYSADGVGGGPGTLLADLTFDSTLVAAGDGQSFSAVSSDGFFALPAGTFWAGISFSGTDPDTLNNLGQGIFDPPTIGSSQDVFFQSYDPADGTSNPSGNFYDFNGVVPANFGWSFDVTPPAAVPEASTTVSFGLLLMLGLGGVAVAARKKKAAA